MNVIEQLFCMLNIDKSRSIDEQFDELSEKIRKGAEKYYLQQLSKLEYIESHVFENIAITSVNELLVVWDLLSSAFQYYINQQTVLKPYFIRDLNFDIYQTKDLLEYDSINEIYLNMEEKYSKDYYEYYFKDWDGKGNNIHGNDELFKSYLKRYDLELL